ncbi:MAG: UDP-glucose/GDP-mannose dehydrogenase family protein [Pseudomonadota bacterium]
MNITIYGSGYVGLVTGSCLADVGNNVLCVDIDEAKVARLKQGDIPIFEPGLDNVITRNVEMQRLDFTTDMDRAVAHAEVQFIAVGTPPGEDGSADMQYVLAVAETIGSRMTEPRIIVNKSTVPVGTADRVSARVQAALAERGVDVGFSVVSNPEFLKEGAAIGDFMKPDRIIVGTDNAHATGVMRELYGPFVRNHDRLIFMDVRSAELTKYAANAMLATKISFMNELSNLADRLGADIEKVRIGIGSDPRIGYSFIYPGCGYGGSCFPKDVKALVATARENDYEPQLLAAVEDVNERQKRVLQAKIDTEFGQDLSGKTFAFWGLAFKPNTDDMREAPARVLMESLWARGATIKAYDPIAMNEARHLYPDDAHRLQLMGTALDAVQGADALVINTEWREFRSPDWPRIVQSMSTNNVFDGRNMFEPGVLAQHGVRYHCIGRPNSSQSAD